MRYLILSMLVSISVFAQTEANRSFVAFANSYIPELDERVLTREEMWKEPVGKEYFPINDIITKKTLFIPKVFIHIMCYRQIITFDTFVEYEEFYNLTRLYEQDKSKYEVKKVKAPKPLVKK